MVVGFGLSISLHSEMRCSNKVCAHELIQAGASCRVQIKKTNLDTRKMEGDLVTNPKGPGEAVLGDLIALGDFGRNRAVERRAEERVINQFE